MEAGTFSKIGDNGIRGVEAYRVPDFDISRRVGGKAIEVPAAMPETETDRSLARSRELLERLRRMVAEQ